MVSGNFDFKIIYTFIIPVLTRNMVDLKDEVLTKINERLMIAIIAEIRDQIKQEVSEALQKEIKKREE